jgi:hypothetical protein
LARALGLPPGEPLVLSTSQAVSAVVGAGALAVIVRRYRQSGDGLRAPRVEANRP